MSNDKISLTLLEHLPVEIFLQIFAFLPWRELVTSFSGLNFYIDSIIQSVRGKSHGIRYNDIDAMNLLQLFPALIDRLVVVNANIVDLSSLTNLRSLTLEYGTKAQLNTIRPHYFPKLEILHIKALRTTLNDRMEAISDLFQVILSNGFPQLRICTALDIGTVPFSDTWIGSSSLQMLNLKMETDQDYEKLLLKLPDALNMFNNILTALSVSGRKRLNREFLNLKQLESENKFILDISPAAPLFDSNKPPPRFNNSRMDKRPLRQDVTIIQGRILPQSELYCRASFLIEIALARDYPFKYPEITFLDPIYHPNISTSGTCCGCLCGFGFAVADKYRPTTSLSSIITTIIDIIDSPFTSEESHNPERLVEYRNDYQTFCKKALACTLSYGRPRY
ncbi:unnamed protein product [Adineta steineri]|uniref:UBC core domain-containing protein n=1 Tax=Adineta steineri TaxID=433720 RepID=A0A819X012_9BILA|nr:unnamed protein product [Adineta steineri]CAF1480098.1 unnamed protein product [Adineta steineri]CAF3785498.1 unnamed protein product [Adineta steineri]CAF4133121.1 unnamed protein product [Adineta steineri]